VLCLVERLSAVKYTRNLSALYSDIEIQLSIRVFIQKSHIPTLPCTRRSHRREPLSIPESHLLPKCHLRLLLFVRSSNGSIEHPVEHAERRLILRPSQWRHRELTAMTRSNLPWLLTDSCDRKAMMARAPSRLQHLRRPQTAQHYPKHSSICSTHLRPTTQLPRSILEAAVSRFTSTCTHLCDLPSHPATPKPRD